MSSNPQIEDGFTMIANELLERVLGFGFSHREQSVVFTIFRKTYGYGKKEDDISASQIGDMCGMARPHVTSTLNLLTQKNVINKKVGRYGSVIGIQKDHSKWLNNEQLKSLSASTESVQVYQNGTTSDSTESVQGGVPNWYAASTESVQVDSTESVHTKENLPKENQQKKGLPSLATEISIAMRKNGIRSQPADPRLIALAEQGVTIETVASACAEAIASKPGESIGVGYVVKIIERWSRDAASIRVSGAGTPNARASPAAKQPQSRHSGFEKLDYSAGINADGSF